MHPHSFAVECAHGADERAQVVCSRIFEIDGDVEVTHAEPRYHAAFIRDRMFGRRQREIDYCRVTVFGDRLELFARRLPRRTYILRQLNEVGDAAEIGHVAPSIVRSQLRFFQMSNATRIFAM